MNKRDVAELKKRLKKEDCTITKLCGCYVDGYKNEVTKLKETFLNLNEDEFYKYLEIAKKVLSGKIGNNVLNLTFPKAEENLGGRQQFLIGLKASALKNDDLLDRFYELVINTYDYVGNYLILIFHDAYDVMTKTSDNLKLDESEEVYEYLLCAICPVNLSKPGLGYLEEENRIGVRLRDWVVAPPETGFVFPAFSDRSTDIHSILYYTKNPTETHQEFMEGGLGCDILKTTAERKETFHSIIKSSLGAGEEKSNDVILEIQESLNDMIEEQDIIYDKKRDPIPVTSDTIQNILTQKGISKEVTKKVEQAIEEEFGDELPFAEDLVDTKALAKNAQKKKEKELVQQVHTLKKQLHETKVALNGTDEDMTDEEYEEMIMQEEVPGMQDDSAADRDASDEDNELSNDEDTNVTSNDEAADELNAAPAPDMDDFDIKEDDTPEHKQYDVFLRVKPQKVSQISYQMINGKKCMIIPVDEDEQANINGVEMPL